MKALRTRRLAALAASSISIAVVACGSSSSSSGAGSGKPLTCEWLAGPNCYQSAVAAASSCLPPTTEQGTLSSDGKTCTYADGHVVTFSTPLTLPLPSAPLFNFTLTNNGAECLTVVQTSSAHSTVQTSAGTFAQNADPTSETIDYVCPDGTTYSATGSASLALLSCEGGLFASPGWMGVSSSTAVSFDLVGTGSGTQTRIFDCATK
jgi:hypothetical protein